MNNVLHSAMKGFGSLALAAAALTSLTSCKFDDLCYDHNHTVSLKMEYDWQDAPSAQPKTMSVFLFPCEGGSPMRYEITEREGMTIKVPKGSYDIITYNSDTHNIRRRNADKFSTFELTTDEAEMLEGLSTLGLMLKSAPQAPGSESMRVVDAPEIIWSDAVTSVNISDESNGRTLFLRPRQIIDEVSFNISHIENVEYLQGLSGTIYDMAGGFHPGVGIPGSEQVILPFELDIDRDTASATGKFTTFGHCPETTGRHLIYLYAVLKDGSKWYYTFDMTDEIHRADDASGNWTFSIETLDLQKPPEGSGGLSVSIDDWNNTDVNLEM